MLERGFFVVPRSLAKSSIWPRKSGYFLDLVQMAVFKSITTSYLGAAVRLERGQLITSCRFLAKRWGVSKTSASSLLKRLEEESLLRRQTIRLRRTRNGTGSGTRITICNFHEYQPLRGSHWSGRDNTWDTGPDKEEARDKNQAAAVCDDRAEEARCPAPPLTPQERTAAQRVVDVIESTTRSSLTAVETGLEELAELNRAGLSWQYLRERARMVAVRQLERGDIPTSVRYYTRVFREDDLPLQHAGCCTNASEEPRNADDPSRSEVPEPWDAAVQGGQGRMVEPELGDNYEGFKRTLRQLGSSDAREGVAGAAEEV